MIFCDTSAVAKFYVPEPESKAVRKRFEAEQAVCLSELARTELMAVFRRRLREAKWTRAEFMAVLQQFGHDDIGGFWTWLPLDKSITDAAAHTFTVLPDTVFLRSSDCLHLVTALQHNFTEVFTYDVHQKAAAAAMGLKPMTV